MNERTKTGLEILQAAALVGVAGNILLRQTPWGLNAFLFVTVFVAAMLMLMRRRRPELFTANTIALCGAMVFFASMYLFRSSEQLLVFDTLAILGIMGVLLLANFGVKAHLAGAFHYIAGFLWAGVTSAFGSFLLLGADIDWKSMPARGKVGAVLFSVLRGLAIALPLLLIFGGLFMAADAAFEGLVNRVINFDLDRVVSHVLITSALAWLTAGYFRGALVPFSASQATVTSPIPDMNEQAAGETKSEANSSFVDKVAEEAGEPSPKLPGDATILEHINRSDPPATKEAEPKAKRDWQNLDNSVVPNVFTLGGVEIGVILGLVNLLFLTFVIIQIPYLFGGMDFVQNTPDFKLAEYARRGFGELVAVAAIVLPVLLLSHWLLRRENALPERLFKILAGIQIGLLFVIMASAVQRLVLLTGELGYGMTTVRFYPMVFMTWLAVVFAWFALTILRGARNHFAWGALWAAIVVLGATNVINPDAFIVRTNFNLMAQGREFDARYNTSLSDDAIPVLMEHKQEMKLADRCIANTRLRSRMLGSEDDLDLRSWNYSRRHAKHLMAADESISTEAAVFDLCNSVPPAVQDVRLEE